MSDYIKRQDASNWLKQYGQDVLHGKYKFSLMYIWKNIMDLPSADVAPVVHSQWVLGGYDDMYYVCEKCRHKQSEYYIKPTANFCPNCGAKMDGEE